MTYKKKVVETTTSPNTNALLGGLVGQFLGGYSTNLFGAAGGLLGGHKTTKRKVTKYK